MKGILFLIPVLFFLMISTAMSGGWTSVYNISCTSINDVLYVDDAHIYTPCNRSGGIDIIDKNTFSTVGFTPEYLNWYIYIYGFGSDSNYIYATYRAGSLLMKYNKFTGSPILNTTSRIYGHFSMDGSYIYACVNWWSGVGVYKIDYLNKNVLSVVDSLILNQTCGDPKAVFVDGSYLYVFQTICLSKYDKNSKSLVWFVNTPTGVDDYTPLFTINSDYLYYTDTDDGFTRGFKKSDGSFVSITSVVQGDEQLSSDYYGTRVYTGYAVDRDNCKVYFRGHDNMTVLRKNDLSVEKVFIGKDYPEHYHYFHIYVYNKPECDVIPPPPVVCRLIECPQPTSITYALISLMCHPVNWLVCSWRLFLFVMIGLIIYYAYTKVKKALGG